MSSLITPPHVLCDKKLLRHTEHATPLLRPSPRWHQTFRMLMYCCDNVIVPFHVHALAEKGYLANAGGRETSAVLTTQALTVEGKVSKSKA